MIINPFTPIPKSNKSHVKGWALHWSESIDQPIHREGDYSGDLYFEHGVNFGGSLNLFGGVTCEIVDNLKQLVASTDKLYSLDIPMPDYDAMLKKRGVEIPGLKEKLANAITLTQRELPLKHLTYGDSHATAYAPYKSRVIRVNGQTLYGALKDNKIPEDANLIVLGSIDIRHHLMRQPDPREASMEMIKELQSRYPDAKLGTPVPVEHEERRIPKTGHYKGMPFFGSRKDRQALTSLFKAYTHVRLPDVCYIMDGKAYADEYMELGSSVHIAPTHYRRVGGWNV